MKTKTHTPPSGAKLALGLLAVSALALGVSGCSSSSSSNSGASAGKTTAVNGVAAKGILQNAIVEACVLADCSDNKDPIATAITDNKGAYSLRIPDNNAGTLVIRVRAGENSKMICETADCFGDSIDMPSDLTLRTVATVESSATTVSAHISPVTELVTAAAVTSKGGAKLNADAVEKGNKAVRKILGIAEDNADAQDLTKIKPIDITKADADVSDDLALQLSLVSAAFADTDTAADETIKTKIEKITSGIESGSIAKSDLADIADKAKAALNVAASKNQDSPLADKKDDIASALDEAKDTAAAGCADGADGECNAAPEPADTSDDEKNTYSANVQAVKALVADVREIGWEIYPQIRNALDEDSLETFDTNNIFYVYDHIEDVINADTEVALEGLGEIAGYVAFYALHASGLEPVENMPTGNTVALSEVVSIDNNPRHTQFGGNIEVISATSWGVTDATFTVPGDKVVTVSLKASLTGVANQNNLQDIKLAITDVSATYTGTGTATINLASANLEVKTNKAVKRTDIEADNLTGVYFDKIKIAATNAVVTHKQGQSERTFTGSLLLDAKSTAALRTANANNISAVLPEKIELDGKFEIDGSFIEAKVAFKVNNLNDLAVIMPGTELDIPVSLTKSADNKKVTVKVGANGKYASYDIVLRDSYVDYFSQEPISQKNIAINNCKNDVSGQIPNFFWWCGDEYDWDMITVDNDITTIQDALVYAVENSFYQLEGILAGEFRSESGWAVYGYDDYVDLAEVVEKLKTANSSSFNAFSDDLYMDETDSKFANATLTVESKAKFSTSLPEVGIKLVANRDARFGGNAKLTLNWKENDKGQKFIVIDATVKGTSSDNLEDSLVVKVSDAKGTQVTLVDGLEGSANRMFISKDGTNYAKVTKESGIYWLTYLYNENGERVDNGKHEFESLF